MLNYIYLRSSLDWNNIKSIEDYIKANNNSRSLIKTWLPELIEVISKWNECFNIDYFEFRAKMKEITISNISQIKNAIIINKKNKEIISNKENFLIYLIDDDDWVSENLFDCVIKNLNSTDDVVVWPFGFFRHYVMITDIDKPIHDIKYIYSNNAIITKKGYDKLFKICKSYDFLEDHRKSDECAQNFNFSIKKIYQPLSAYNQSPASATKLWSLSKDKENTLFSLISDYEKIPLVPDELNWTLPYFNKFRILISKLKKRKIF